MGIHITEYKTEGGKTRKVKRPAESAGKNGAADNSGAGNKNQKPGDPAKQGA